MIGTATSNGKPIALTRRRSTFGRDGLNLAALKDMTEGAGQYAEPLLEHRQRVRVHLQLGLRVPDGRPRTSRSGLLPRPGTGSRPAAPDARHRRYEWQGFLSEHAAPAFGGRPEWAAAELEQPVGSRASCTATTTPYGSVHRVELFDQFPARVTLANDVSVMNRAATEDVRSPVWPVVSQVLHGGAAPEPARRPGP